MKEKNLGTKSGKGIVSRIYRELLIKQQKNKIKQNSPVFKGTTNMKRHFNKDILLASKHIKICSVSLTIREMQTKATKNKEKEKYQPIWYTPIRAAKMKNSDNTNSWQRQRETAPFINC